MSTSELEEMEMFHYGNSISAMVVGQSLSPFLPCHEAALHPASKVIFLLVQALFCLVGKFNTATCWMVCRAEGINQSHLSCKARFIHHRITERASDCQKLPPNTSSALHGHPTTRKDPSTHIRRKKVKEKWITKRTSSG